MFFDEVSLELEGGHGGNGCVSFHREKFVPEGPPDGGNGGEGGSVILVADENFNTLHHFAGKKHYKSENGENGDKNNSTGRSAPPLTLKVPVGTLVYDEEKSELLCDLNFHGQTFLVSRGGRGAYGNGHFTSSTRQAPDFAELGDKGEFKRIRLELRLVADVGLLGFPSAGKSTFISHVSSARPKIAAYPFTTLVPNLGVVYLSKFGGTNEQSFVIADMPGIIEGASEGKGLGDTFLKHISRTATLIFLLDPFSFENLTIVDQYKILHSELKKYDPQLLKKTQFVVLNKIDALLPEDRLRLQGEFLKKYPKLKSLFRMASGVSGEGLRELLLEVWEGLKHGKKGRPERPKEELTLYEPTKFVDDQSFELKKMYEMDASKFQKKVLGQIISEETLPKRTLFHVTGMRIEQISRMTNPDQEGGVKRVYDVLKKMGIQNALRRAGAKTGDYIKIEPHFFEFHDF